MNELFAILQIISQTGTGDFFLTLGVYGLACASVALIATGCRN